MIAEFIAYLPRIVGALVTFGVGAIACAAIIAAWIFILTRIPSLKLSNKDIASRFILGTLPVLTAFIIMVPVSIAAIGTLNIDRISQPATHYLHKLSAPLPFITTLCLITAAHLFFTRPRSD